MDKTIEIVVVAMVVLVAATVVLFLFQDQTDSFGSFLDSQQNGAQCQLLKTQDKCDSQEFEELGCTGTCSEPSESTDGSATSGSSVTDCPEGQRPTSGGGCVSEGSSAGL
jgi:type II secretory pathway pseudopilin PulG